MKNTGKSIIFLGAGFTIGLAVGILSDPARRNKIKSKIQSFRKKPEKIPEEKNPEKEVDDIYTNLSATTKASADAFKKFAETIRCYSNTESFSTNGIVRIADDYPHNVDYTSFSNTKNTEETKEPEAKDGNEKIFTISPDDLGETGYDTFQYTYWKDGIVTDENNEVVDDYPQIIGNFNESMFGEYDPDAAYIRNMEAEADIEVVREERYYGELLEDKPYLNRTQEEDEQD